MTVIRWHFIDPVADETWIVPINPNEMSSPFPVKNRQSLAAPPMATDTAGFGILTLQAPTPPFEWTFGGVIRTQDHHDQLLAWSRKPNPILIRDHYERTWKVLPLAFEPADRKPTFRTPWRLTYSMRTLMFGRVS